MSLKVLAAALALATAAPAGAATIHEADFGSFSSDWSAPTALAAGAVTGTGAAGDFDILRLTGLASGAQRITIAVSAPDGIGYSYSAGGAVRHALEAFRHGWDGANGGHFQLRRGRPVDSLSFDLGDDFAGDLYLGLYFTHGSEMAYAVSSDRPAATPDPAPVPLPATGLMLAAALAGAGALAARRRR